MLISVQNLLTEVFVFSTYSICHRVSPTHDSCYPYLKNNICNDGDINHVTIFILNNYHVCVNITRLPPTHDVPREACDLGNLYVKTLGGGGVGVLKRKEDLNVEKISRQHIP